SPQRCAVRVEPLGELCFEGSRSLVGSQSVRVRPKLGRGRQAGAAFDAATRLRDALRRDSMERVCGHTSKSIVQESCTIGLWRSKLPTHSYARNSLPSSIVSLTTAKSSSSDAKPEKMWPSSLRTNYPDFSRPPISFGRLRTPSACSPQSAAPND